MFCQRQVPDIVPRRYEYIKDLQSFDIANTFPLPLQGAMVIACSFNRRILATAIALFVLPVAVSCKLTPPSAPTRNGTYVGRYNPEYDQDFFLGIPFAQPPIGDLRFANPQPLTSSFSEARDATEYSSQCVGYGVSSNPIFGFYGCSYIS